MSSASTLTRSFFQAVLILILVCCSMLASVRLNGCQAAQIWLAAPEPGWRLVRHWPPNNYMQLFEPDAPWQRAQANVSVFGFTKRFILESSDAELSAIAKTLEAHHIKIAVQATPLIATKQCGLGSESFGPPDDMAGIALKLKRAGADLSYLDMDEPLYFGFFWNGRPPIIACHLPIEEVARETAAKLQAVRKVFPHVIIGDIEPMGITPSFEAAWIKDISLWMDAYQRAMGEPLGFLQADVVWQSPSWPFVLTNVASMLHARKVPLGIIYNSTPFDTSDVSWIDDAQAHFELVEGRMHIKPDQAVIETWTDFPRQILPDSAPDSLTNLVLRYAAWEAKQH